MLGHASMGWKWLNHNYSHIMIHIRRRKCVHSYRALSNRSTNACQNSSGSFTVRYMSFRLFFKTTSIIMDLIMLFITSCSYERNINIKTSCSNFVNNGSHVHAQNFRFMLKQLELQVYCYWTSGSWSRNFRLEDY